LDTTPLTLNPSKQQKWEPMRHLRDPKTTRHAFISLELDKQERAAPLLHPLTGRKKEDSTRIRQEKITKPLPTGPAEAPSRQRKGKGWEAVANISRGMYSRMRVIGMFAGGRGGRGWEVWVTG